MIKLLRLFYYFLLTTIVISEITQGSAEAFLANLESGKVQATNQSKKAKKSKTSKGMDAQVGKVALTDDNATTWLASLSKQSSYLDQEKKKEEERQKAEQAQELQNLSVVESYYGNPDYQSAMQILQNSALQQDYEQAMNNMQIFFFEYTQKILNKYHSSHKKKKVPQNTKSVTSFLSSLSDTTVAPAKISSAVTKSTHKATTVVKASPVSSSSGSQSSATSFLASLEG